MKSIKNYINEKQKALSCGFIVCTDDGLLCCHPTGRMYGNRCWDIPKGHKEAFETELDCAKRELKEETGLVFDELNAKPIDCGRFAYNDNKDLYLFLIEVDHIDVDKLVCTSYFDGDTLEVDNYMITKNTNKLFKRLKNIVDSILEKHPVKFLQNL